MECSYDEADDRLMFYLNHAVRVDNFTCAHVASRDTDIMVCLMYHQLTWRRYGLSELWMHNSGNVTALHESVESIPDELIRSLPAVHAHLDGTQPANLGRSCKITEQHKRVSTEHW